MAFSLRCALIPIFIASVLLLSHSVNCDHDEEDLLLQNINLYRASLNLTALIKNDNAECLAEKVADQFQHQPCTNTTGANTIPGTEPQFPNYPTLLAKCRLNVSNTRDGAILPACVPNLETTLVASNFTKSQYSDYLNKTDYTGIGIGHEDNWIVVVLTTNTPEGSFVPALNTIDDDDNHDDKNDHNDDHDDKNDHNDDHDDKNDHDDEDILLQGINAHRATTRVPALIKTEVAECFADEYADRFQYQPCSNTSGSITAPTTATNISAYPDLLLKCGLTVSYGIVLPVCASLPSTVLSSLKSSQYSTALNDPNFTEAGVGSEDDWLVVVLTTTSPNAGNTPNPFNKANAVDGVNGISNAGFVPETSFVCSLLLAVIGGFIFFLL